MVLVAILLEVLIGRQSKKQVSPWRESLASLGVALGQWLHHGYSLWLQYSTVIAIVTTLGTGGRSGTPSWGRSPHTPLKSIVLSNLAAAIRADFMV